MQQQQHPVFSSSYIIFIFFIIYPCLCTIPKTLSNYLSDVNSVHISFGNQTNEICIIWASSTHHVTDSTISLLLLPRVRYGLTKQTMLQSATGKTIPFNTGQKGKRFLHRVIISDLLYGMNYYYQIITFNTTIPSESNSPIFTLKTPPSPTSGYQTNFLVFADLGTLSKSIPYIVQESLNYDYSSVFHIGDIAYDLNSEEGKVGEQFISLLKTMVTRLPYLTIPGDHESFDGYEFYRHLFSMPKQEWPMSAKRLWYSFDIGLVHFIMLVTEDFITENLNMHNQLKWLDNDLKEANINRYRVPWIVVLAHRPLYCSVESLSEDCAKKNPKVRKYLEDVLFTGGVDLVISGHEHNYERTFPVYKKRVLAYHYKNAFGPVYLVVGSCGYPYVVDRLKSQREYWSAFAVSDDRSQEMFGRLHVYNKSHIYWEMLRADNNQKVDRMWLIKDQHGPFTLSRIFPKKHSVDSRNNDQIKKYLQGNVHSKTSKNVIYTSCLLLALILIFLMKTRFRNLFKNRFIFR